MAKEWRKQIKKKNSRRVTWHEVNVTLHMFQTGDDEIWLFYDLL